jgi:hypothetical protein
MTRQLDRHQTITPIARSDAMMRARIALVALGVVLPRMRRLPRPDHRGSSTQGANPRAAPR